MMNSRKIIEFWPFREWHPKDLVILESDKLKDLVILEGDELEDRTVCVRVTSS